MAARPRFRVQTKKPPRPTDASRALRVARQGARFSLQQLGSALGVQPRTIARWETGATHPSQEQWSKTVAYLARFALPEAVALARAAGVASPITEAPPVDGRAIEDALLRAADLLDVSPRRVRAAVREITRATAGAHGTLADLAHAAEEKAREPGGEG